MSAMSPISRRSESKAGPSPSSTQQQGPSSSNHTSTTTTMSTNTSEPSNSSNAANTSSMVSGAYASDSSFTGLVTRLHEIYPSYPTYPSAASSTSSASANSSPSPKSSPLITPLPHPHHNPRHYLHLNRHPRQHQHHHQHQHTHPSSPDPGSRSDTLSSRLQTLDVSQNLGQDQNYNENEGQCPSPTPSGSQSSRQTHKHQKKTNKNSGNKNGKRDRNTNRQLHSQLDRGTSSHHPTVNSQGSDINDGQAPSSTSTTPFESSNIDPSVGATYPYWPEYQQPSHPPALPLNCDASPSQYHRHATVDRCAPIAAPAPIPVESPRIAPPRQQNQNQVHAQTHPWRIKVYSACLSCRKKKIKCDGQSTCQRCARLGFECSYIEVPHTPQDKSSKQKQKSSAADASDTRLNSNAAKTGASKGQGHPARGRPPVQHHHQSNNPAEVAKETQQQRRSSIKDTASGSALHSTSRHNKQLPPPKDIVGEKPLPAVGPISQASRKDLRLRDVTVQPGSRPMSAFVMDRDVTMPDLYHILVDSVTIPNVSKFSQSTPQTPSLMTGQGGGDVLMGMDQLNLTLASPAIPTFTVLNSDHIDPDQHHSFFQKDPSSNSFLDHSAPLGFVITNKSVVQYLVHVYFECFHFHWMIVDKEKFLAQLKDPSAPPDPLLLVAICAAGAKYSDHEGLCVEPGNMSTIGEQFLTHARILLQDRFDMPSMSTLQALLILYWCQVQTGRASLRFMYVGMAIRMAQEMGLNRPIDTKRLKDMDEREVQIRKTIWWACYQADRWTSAALGKPMVISDIDCLVDYPVSLNDNERFHVRSFQHMTNLAKILGKVILNLYTSTNAATCSSAVFQHLDQSLSSWIGSMTSASFESESVPPTPMPLESAGGTPSSRSSSSQCGKSSTSSKSATPASEEAMGGGGSAASADPSAVGYYTLLFHTVRIILHRPFLHNSALAPVLPLTMQSPLSRCRESALAISEIAENMVAEQRSYRQLFNSIHISLCTAATVHRFMILSTKTASQQNKDMDSVENRSREEPATVGIVTTSTPPTLPNAASYARTDLHCLTLLLRILQNCSRFSIEKNLLRDILDGYLPQKHMSPQDLAWAREAIHKPLSIAPFTIKMPTQSSTGSRSMVDFNLSSMSSPASNSMEQARQQARPPSAMQQTIDVPPRPTPQQDASTPQTQAQQHQQYQLHLRQQQHEQQQAKQQGRTRRLNASTSDMSSSNTNHSQPFGAYDTRSVSTDDSRQMRSVSRTSSMSGPSEYVTTMAPDTFSSPTMGEQQQLQQYQRELDLLQQQHRIQQSELTQHHQQQSLQLEQEQMYQQQQQNQEYMRQSQQQQSMFAQQQPNSVGSSQQSGSLYSQSRPSSTGMLSPQTPFPNQPSRAVVRNKRQSEASLKKKQAKQRQQGSQQNQRQKQGHHQQSQERQQQQIQGYSQIDSRMSNATPPEADRSMALGSLSGTAGSDKMMTSNSTPSVIGQVINSTDIPGICGIANLTEFLGIEPTRYYPEMSATSAGDEYRNMDLTTPPLAGPSTAAVHNHLAGSSNSSDGLWHIQQQQPSATGSGNSGNTGNSQGRSNYPHRSSINENIDNGNLEHILGNNINDSEGRYAGGPMMTPDPMNAATTWLGFDNINPGNPSQLSPLHPPGQSESPVGYHYPYAFQHVLQQFVSHLGNAQDAPFAGYHAVARSIAYTPAPSYAYATDNNGAMAMYVQAPAPHNMQGPYTFDASGLAWQQQHAQNAPPQPASQDRQQQQQGHTQPMYSPRTLNQGYSDQLQQQGRTPTYHYVQLPAPLDPQQQHDQLTPQQKASQQQHQDSQHQQQQQQPRPQQQRQRLPKPRQQVSPQQQQQKQQQQQQQKQSRPDQHQVRHPSATLLPPLPQTSYRDENGGQPFSPASSSSTLVNPGSASNNSSQQESNRGGSSGRETSSRDSTSRSTSPQFESSSRSSSDSTRMSHSAGSSTGGSNKSSSMTASPNSTEEASNSNESGSSSDNNGDSRSSSADLTVEVTGNGSINNGSGSAGGNNSGSSNASNSSGVGNSGSFVGGSSGGGHRRRRSKKSVSPSGSADSSTSSSNATGLVSNSQAQARHYRTHNQGQEGGGSSGSGGGSRSPSSGEGSHQGNGRRKRKHRHKHRSSSREDSRGTMDGSTAVSSSGSSGSGSGSSGSNKSDHRNQYTPSSGSGVSSSGGNGGGDGGQIRVGRRRADSDSGASGSGSGSNSGLSSNEPSNKGATAGHGRGGNGGDNSISTRRGKGKGGKAKSGNRQHSSKGQLQQPSTVLPSSQQQPSQQPKQAPQEQQQH